MAYLINGIIKDADGYPFDGTVQAEEVGTSGAILASAWSEPGTGKFMLSVENQNSIVRVIAPGHKTVTYRASQLPIPLKLEPSMEISGTIAKMKDNSLWWALGIFGAITAISVATGKKKTVATKTAAAKTQPRIVNV